MKTLLDFFSLWVANDFLLCQNFNGVNGSLSIAAPESSSVTSSGSKQGGLIDERVRNSGSNSPGSGAASEQEHADRKVSSSPQNMDSYADIGLVHDSNASYTPSESQLQQQDPPELPTFSVSLVFFCILIKYSKG